MINYEYFCKQLWLYVYENTRGGLKHTENFSSETKTWCLTRTELKLVSKEKKNRKKRRKKTLTAAELDMSRLVSAPVDETRIQIVCVCLIVEDVYHILSQPPCLGSDRQDGDVCSCGFDVFLSNTDNSKPMHFPCSSVRL